MEELAKQRLEICLKCENKLDTPYGLTCDKCGCPIMKIIYSIEKGCNINKW
jgi:hypothetical protein